MPGGEYHQAIIRSDHRDSAGPVQPPVAAHQVCPDAGQVLLYLATVVPVAHVPVAPAEHARPVERTGDCLPCAVDPSGVGDRDDRSQQRLARDTPPVGAFPADQLPLHHRDAESSGPGAVGDIQADRSGADDDDVVDVVRGCAWYRFAHGCSLLQSVSVSVHVLLISCGPHESTSTFKIVSVCPNREVGIVGCR